MLSAQLDGTYVRYRVSKGEVAVVKFFYGQLHMVRMLFMVPNNVNYCEAENVGMHILLYIRT